MLGWEETLIRLSLASLFGALIGLERERKDWVAGMRTHMIVCVGSCLIMIVSAFGFSDILGTEHVTLDPSRIAAQVVSGIGFIGAGTILFSKEGTIRGLTTAAGLWTVAAIGLATGGGLYFAAGATTILALIILWALQPVEQIYSKRFRHETLRIVTDAGEDNAEVIKNLLHENDLRIQAFNLERKHKEFVFQVKFESIEVAKLDAVVNALKDLPAIKEINWLQ